MKNIFVIGSGAREHAIAWALSKSSQVNHVYIAPGNAAVFEKGKNVSIPVDDFDALVSFAKNNEIYFTIVGPEAPLAAGIVDIFTEHDVPIFGPDKVAAQLESSKIFSKDVMNNSGVPTADARSFSDLEKAKEYVAKKGVPIVIKADGLAAGKGVFVAQSESEANAALDECLKNNKFGDSGSQVLIEEFLSGKEASVMAIISKDKISMLPVSSDYKRAYDNDQGPNTGGMGAITPSPVLSESRLEEVKKKVFEPVIHYLNEKGICYTGFLYAGLMVDKNGSFKVLEFNCRLGDPETQALLMRIEDELFTLIESALFSPVELPDTVEVNNDVVITLVMASEGYPGKVNDGKLICKDLATDRDDQSMYIFQAGTYRKEDKIYTKGGRILSVTVKGDTIEEVRQKAYEIIKEPFFEGMHFRTDIGL